MATLEEGVYNILCVQTKKGLEVQNGSDAKNANVQMWTVHGGDAQIWCATKPEGDNGNWQIVSSMSGLALGVDSATGGANVKQVSDTNNTSTQRWVVTDTGKTTTYNGTTYPIFVITVAGNTSLGLDVMYMSTENGANVAIYGTAASTATQNQQWIFVPVRILSDNGFYRIAMRGSVTDNSYMVLSVSNSNANQPIKLEAHDELKDGQIFLAEASNDTNAFRFISGLSGLSMGLTEDADPANRPTVYQLTKQNSTKQFWLPVGVSNPTKMVKTGGSTYRVYEVRSQLGAENSLSMYRNGKVSDVDAYLHPRFPGNMNQQWIFIPTEGALSTILAPGSAYILSSNQKTTNITTSDTSEPVAVSGITFQSSETEFQARYHVCLKNYNKSKTTWVDVANANEWKNLNVHNGSSAHSGWGASNTPTFGTSNSEEATKVDNIVTISPEFFTENIQLNSTNAVSAELTIQIRGFRSQAVKIGTDGSGNNKYAGAHGAVTETKFTITQIPSTTISSVGISTTSDGEIAIRTVITNTPQMALASARARLIGSDGKAISDWASSSSATIMHPVSLLYRFPHSGESLTIEYYQITSEGTMFSGRVVKTFTTSNSNITFDRTVTYTDDDSCCAIIRSNKHTNDYCLACVQGVDDTQLVTCTSKDETVDGVTKKRFQVAPSLNRDVQVILIGTNGTAWGFEELTVRINSHLFIWNWSYNGMDVEYDEYASILVNSDAPPQQTRSFTTDIKFNTPAGRVHPVGFSMSSLQTDLSVSGVVVDDDADYTAAAPIPQHVSIAELRKLIMLSAQGIHPIYRTPYGDYYSVGIESVDFSKTELGYSNANVKQRAIGD